MLYDFLMLDKESSEPLYIQLYTSFKIAISKGVLSSHCKLPSIRKLSQDLNLSRTTVENAYQQLTIEGYIQSKPQSGYFVSNISHYNDNNQEKNYENKEIKKTKILYDFGTDYIDINAFRPQIWQRFIKDVLHQQEIISSYGDPQGEFELRKLLTEYSNSVRGVISKPQNIIIGAGTQPLLYILGAILRKNLNITKIAIEEPGFKQAEIVFKDCDIEIVRLKNSHEDNIKELVEKDIKCIYINQSDRNNITRNLQIKERLPLLDWANKYDGFIIEDDYNGELRYTTKPIPALQSVSNGKKVIYLGSFSKILLPSVRIGYMSLTDELLSYYTKSKNYYNQTASKIEQLALAQFIKAGELEKQLRRLRKLYITKGTILVEKFKDYFGDEIENLYLQETALRVVVKLKKCNNSQILLSKALNLGVQIISYKKDLSQIDGRIVLGFAGIEEWKIEKGVALLYNAYSQL